MHDFAHAVHSVSWLFSFLVTLARSSSLFGLVLIANSHQLANNKVLLKKPFLPALERFQLLLVEIAQSVERAVKVLGKHLLVKATAGETAGGIATRKVSVGTTGSIEVAATSDIEDATTHGQVNGHVFLAVVRQQRPRGEGFEHDGGLFLGNGGRGMWPQPAVCCVEKHAEEDEVEGGDKGPARGKVMSISASRNIRAIEAIVMGKLLLGIAGLLGGFLGHSVLDVVHGCEIGGLRCCFRLWPVLSSTNNEQAIDVFSPTMPLSP